MSPAIIRPSSASSAPRAHMIWLTLMSSCHPRAPRPHSRATNKHTHINTHTRRTNAQTQSATAPTPLPLAASRLCCRTGRTPGELRSILTVTPPCVSASLRAAGVRRWLCVCVGGGGVPGRRGRRPTRGGCGPRSRPPPPCTAAAAGEGRGRGGGVFKASLPFPTVCRYRCVRCPGAAAEFAPARASRHRRGGGRTDLGDHGLIDDGELSTSANKLVISW